jgi:hypothetical protein
MVTVRDIHAAQQHAERRAHPAEQRLASAYENALRQEGARAADAFERSTVTFGKAPAIAASADWQQPTPAEVYDLLLAQARLSARTQAQREALWRSQQAVWGPLGLSLDHVNRLLQGVYPTLGQRITMIAETQRQAIMTVIDHAWQDGLSIRDTGAAIRSEALATSRWRAEMIARTETLGAVNAASLQTVKVSGAASYKVWTAAQDSHVRDTHAEADGQTVPVGQPFQVGSGQLDHPGDPSGPPEEVINCRCTLVYTNEEP